MSIVGRSAPTITILCKYGKKFVGDYETLMRWPFVKNIFQCGIRTEESKTRTIDLREWDITYSIMTILYICLGSTGEKSARLLNLVEWLPPWESNNLYLPHVREYLGLDNLDIFSALQVVSCIQWGTGYIVNNLLFFHGSSNQKQPYVIKFATIKNLYSHMTLDKDYTVTFRGIVRERSSFSDELIGRAVLYLVDDIVHKDGLTVGQRLLLCASQSALEIFVTLCGSDRVKMMTTHLIHNYESLHLIIGLGDVKLAKWFAEKNGITKTSNLFATAESSSGLLPIHVAAWCGNIKMFLHVLSETVSVFGMIVSGVCGLKCKKYDRDVVHYVLKGYIDRNNSDEYPHLLEKLCAMKCISFEAKNENGLTIVDEAMELIDKLPLLSRVLCLALENSVGQAALIEDSSMTYVNDDDAYLFYSEQEEDEPEEDEVAVSEDE